MGPEAAAVDETQKAAEAPAKEGANAEEGAATSGALVACCAAACCAFLWTWSVAGSEDSYDESEEEEEEVDESRMTTSKESAPQTLSRPSLPPGELQPSQT